MKECSFAPKIAGTREKRNVSQFLEDQRKFGEKVKTNADKLAEEVQAKERSFNRAQPIIDPNSKFLAKKHAEKRVRPGSNVHERLYNTNRREENRIKEEAIKEENIQKNKRKIGEELTRFMHLYQDAKIREKTLAHKKEVNEQQHRKEYSYIADPFVLSKFDKEYTNCLTSLGLSAEKGAWLTGHQMSILY